MQQTSDLVCGQSLMSRLAGGIEMKGGRRDARFQSEVKTKAMGTVVTARVQLAGLSSCLGQPGLKQSGAGVADDGQRSSGGDVAAGAGRDDAPVTAFGKKPVALNGSAAARGYERRTGTTGGWQQRY